MLFSIVKKIMILQWVTSFEGEKFLGSFFEDVSQSSLFVDQAMSPISLQDSCMSVNSNIETEKKKKEQYTNIEIEQYKRTKYEMIQLYQNTL